MGICRSSGVAGRRFCEDCGELKAADDCGPAAAAVLDGVVEDQSEMLCRRLQAPG